MAQEGQNGNIPAEQPFIPTVTLNIQSQDGDVVQYKFPSNRRFQYLFRKYCGRKNVEYYTMAFFYDRLPINSASTPAELGLEEGAFIDALMQQHGG